LNWFAVYEKHSIRDWINRRNRKLLQLFETLDSIVGRTHKDVAIQTGVSI
jgi:hypothetical protein